MPAPVGPRPDSREPSETRLYSSLAPRPPELNRTEMERVRA